MSFSWANCGSWLLQSAAAGGVLLLLTLALARCVRQPARRQRLCEYGVLAALLAAVISLLLPGWLLVPHAGGGHLARGVSVPVGLALDPVPGATGGSPAGGTPASGRVVEVQKADVDPEPVESAEEPAPALADRALEWSQTWLLPGLVVVQALGAGLFLGYLLVGHVALLRLLARARPAPPDVIEFFLPMIAKGRPPRLLISEQVRVPLSCGLLRPTVVIPANLCEPAHARKLRWIFAHELTHLRRRDAWSCLLFCVGQALYFYVPWFWWLRRQARLCQEFVADAVAALEEVPPVSYAEFLVSLIRAPAVPMAATGVAGQSSDLFRRVSMLLQNPVAVERDCPRRWSLLAAGSLLALAVVLSGVSLTAQPARAQEKEVIIRRTQGEPVKITIYIEGGDKKEPVIRKDEKVKVLVVPAEKGEKEKRYLYWTPRVIIEKKGDEKDAKAHTFRYWIETDKGPAKDTPKGPVRKGKVIVEKEAQGEKPAPKKETKYRIFTAPHDLHLTIPKLPEGTLPPVWLQQDGKALIQWHAKADVNLEKLRKVLEKLEKIPNVDAEQIRREVMKALEQLHKVQPNLDGKWNIEFRHAPEKGQEEKKHIERKQTNKKDAEPMTLFEFIPQEKARVRAIEALSQVQNRVQAAKALSQLGHAADHPRRLGVEIDLPGAILADQLNLPKDQGVVIQRVLPKSPAEKAGLKVGDVLLEINNVAVPADLQRFPKIVQELPADQAIDVVVIRKGKRRVLHGVRLTAAAPGQSEAIADYRRALSLAQATQPQPKTAIDRGLQALSTAKDGVMTTTFRKGDRFTTRQQEGTLIITVVGDVNNRDALEITIQDGATSNRYNSLDRVPARYRDKVSHLIDISGKGTSPLPR
jgi:beta-lactamase regulating signal transducer with metallopeptidase domain